MTLLVPAAALATGGTQLVTDCGTDSQGNRLYGNDGNCAAFDRSGSNETPASTDTSVSEPVAIPAPTRPAVATVTTAAAEIVTPRNTAPVIFAPIPTDPLLTALAALLHG